MLKGGRDTMNGFRKNGHNKMLTTRELANLLHVHINTVRRWSDMGVIKTYRIGPRSDRRFYWDDIVNFLEGREPVATR
jgi:excisionase family DNA binding protein